MINLVVFYIFVIVNKSHKKTKAESKHPGAFPGSLQVLRAVQTHNSSSPQEASSRLSADFQRVRLWSKKSKT